MKIISYGDGSIHDIKKLEESFNIKLPEDYKNFLIKYNGADIVDGIFYVTEEEIKIIIDYISKESQLRGIEVFFD